MPLPIQLFLWPSRTAKSHTNEYTMVNNKHHGTPGHEAARGTQKDHELCWMSKCSSTPGLFIGSMITRKLETVCTSSKGGCRKCDTSVNKARCGFWSVSLWGHLGYDLSQDPICFVTSFDSGSIYTNYARLQKMVPARSCCSWHL